MHGFAARVSNMTPREVEQLLERYEGVVLPVLNHYGGTIVKALGDSLLITFDSPTHAVLAGAVIQARLADDNATRHEDHQLVARYAVHTGEVETIEMGRHHDLSGSAVDVASRLEQQVPPGEVYFTEATWQAMDAGRVPNEAVGELGDPGTATLTVYRLAREDSEALQTLVGDSDAPDVVPEEQAGRLARGLQHSIDQMRRQPTPPARAGVGRWVLAAALLILIGQLGFAGFRELQYRRQAGIAAQRLEAGEYRQALELLATLRERKPSDLKVQTAMSEAIQAEIDRAVQREDFDRASKMLGTFEERYPYVPGLDAIRRGVRIEAAAHSEYPGTNLLELMDEYPDYRPLEVRFVEVCSELCRDSYAAQMLRVVHGLLEEDPDWIRDPRVREAVRGFLKSSGYDADDPELYELLDRRLYDAAREEIFELVYDAGSEGLHGRVRAHAVILHYGDGDEVNELRYQTAQLLGIQTYSSQKDDALDYFRKRFETESVEHIRAEIDFEAPTRSQQVVLWLGYNDIFDRVIRDLYPEQFRPFLEELAGSDKRHARSAALRILESHGWDSPQVRQRFAAAGGHGS